MSSSSINDKLLFEAASDGKHEVVKELLSKGTGTGYRNELGWTALIVASKYGRLEVVRTLLEYRADVHVKDNHGYTALIYASGWGRLEVVRTLLEYKADVNVKDNRGQDALYYACYGQNWDVAELLFLKGANPDVTDKDGQDALYRACYWKNWDVAELLLLKGANPDVTDRDGDTARNHINKHNKQEMLTKVQRALAEKQRIINEEKEKEEAAERDRQQKEEEEAAERDRQQKEEEEAAERDRQKKELQRLAAVDQEAKAKGLSVELYAEYCDIISSINALQYLEAESNFFQAVEQDKDMEIIEALQIEVDRLESFKPKSSNLVLSVEQVVSKIELFIQTNNVPRAKALAANRDMTGLRAFKELISELKKHLEELSPKSDSYMIATVDISLKDVMSPSNSKIVKLTQRVSDGTKSSNKSIIVDAEFKGMQVKVKLKKDLNALLREYSIMESLNMKAPHYFIRPYDLVSYDKGELVPFDGSYEDLSGLYGIVMEYGKIDMKAYSQVNFIEPNFLIEFKSVGFDVSEIIKTAHSSNIVLMDLKPANIVRVMNNNGKINHKAIDYDEAIDLNTISFSTAISSTPKYIAPEVAKAMLYSTENNEFKPTVAVDVFSFGLWVFEVFNDQVSFWTCLGVDESKDGDILISASELTDDQIQRVINAKLGDMKSTAARTWLLDALKVNPYDRLTIERLNAKHSLFTTNYATIGMNNLATKTSVDQAADKIIAVSNDNTRQIMENNYTQSNEQFSALLHRLSNLETDVTGINRKLESISSVLEVLVGNKQDCPRLIIILPKDGNRYLQMLMNPVDAALFKSPMIVKFVCPITYKSIDDYEVEIKDAREFVKKYGPILLISIRILQVGMTVGKLLGLPLPSADLFPASKLKSIVALNNSNNTKDKLTTLALNKMSDVINQQIDQSLETFTTQLDACLNPTVDSFNNMQINQSLQTITNANYKEFFKLLTKNYTMDLANELRGKMCRVCGGDGCVEWVSVAGEDLWYNKHGRLDDTNVKLNNSIHNNNNTNNNNKNNAKETNSRQCCTLS